MPMVVALCIGSMYVLPSSTYSTIDKCDGSVLWVQGRAYGPIYVFIRSLKAETMKAPLNQIASAPREVGLQTSRTFDGVY